eukprot:7894281-Alexandrium_andersonii.AAC.1
MGAKWACSCNGWEVRKWLQTCAWRAQPAIICPALRTKQNSRQAGIHATVACGAPCQGMALSPTPLAACLLYTSDAADDM